MPHLSYLFCTTWGLCGAEPVAETAVAAIGGGPDPLEWMEDAGMTAARPRLAPAPRRLLAQGSVLGPAHHHAAP